MLGQRQSSFPGCMSPVRKLHSGAKDNPCLESRADLVADPKETYSSVCLMAKSKSYEPNLWRWRQNLIPTALLFSRYRAFREFTRLELAPLTVIIGKNGGGKRFSTRLPLLLASGLEAEAEAPLDLNAGGVSHAARYEDLIYQRSAQPFCLGAEISENGRTLRFVTTLRHIVERHD